MPKTIEMIEPKEGEDGQWLGVYITRWGRDWDPPTAMFRDKPLSDVPEVKALIDAARAAEDYISRCEFDSDLEREAAEGLRSALAPFGPDED